MTKVGAEWQLSFSSNSVAPGSYGNITVTARAFDAAGNQSGPTSAVVSRQFFG